MAVVRYMHKIMLNDRNDVFLISNYQPEKTLSITLIDIDRCEAFSGISSNIELRSLAAVLRMSFSVFISLTTKALTQKETDDLKFLYSFEENCQDFLFKWKSIDIDETTITLGIVKMVKNDYASTIKNVFTLLSDEFSNLNKKVADNEFNLNIVVKEKEDALSLLAEATNVKESIEKELYSKFALVLNQKKQKIRELNQNSNKVLKKLNVSNSKPISTKKSFHEISESSDEIDGDLDDLNAPGPSNLKRDSSLLFDDEPVVSISPSKIRKRNATKATVIKDAASDVEIESKKDSDTESEDDLLKNL